MTIGIYLNFKDNTKEVIHFYEKVFGSKCTDLMTYGQQPDESTHELDEKTKGLVMNASLEIEADTVMFSDVPDFMGMDFIPGNNVTLVLETKDSEKLTAYFNGLLEGATKVMPLQKTFWSDSFGQLTDKFGISWSFNLTK